MAVFSGSLSAIKTQVHDVFRRIDGPGDKTTGFNRPNVPGFPQVKRHEVTPITVAPGLRLARCGRSTHFSGWKTPVSLAMTPKPQRPLVQFAEVEVSCQHSFARFDGLT